MYHTVYTQLLWLSSSLWQVPLAHPLMESLKGAAAIFIASPSPCLAAGVTALPARFPPGTGASCFFRSRLGERLSAPWALCPQVCGLLERESRAPVAGSLFSSGSSDRVILTRLNQTHPCHMQPSLLALRWPCSPLGLKAFHSAALSMVQLLRSVSDEVWLGACGTGQIGTLSASASASTRSMSEWPLPLFLSVPLHSNIPLSSACLQGTMPEDPEKEQHFLALALLLILALANP